MLILHNSTEGCLFSTAQLPSDRTLHTTHQNCPVQPVYSSSDPTPYFFGIDLEDSDNNYKECENA